MEYSLKFLCVLSVIRGCLWSALRSSRSLGCWICQCVHQMETVIGQLVSMLCVLLKWSLSYMTCRLECNGTVHVQRITFFQDSCIGLQCCSTWYWIILISDHFMRDHSFLTAVIFLWYPHAHMHVNYKWLKSTDGAVVWILPADSVNLVMHASDS